MRDLKELAIRGGFIKIWIQGASFLLRIVSLMVLARLLEPRDFGLVAMVTAVTGVFDLFKTAGLSIVTVQREEITDEQVSTLFWINVGVGAMLAGLTVALAPVLTAFYREPRLIWITMLLASGFVFTGIGVQHSALLQRRLRFGTLAIIDLASLVAGTAVGIGMALAGSGYWSLVGMALTFPLVSSAGALALAGWVPGPPRRGVGALSMLKFGGTVTIDGLVAYVAFNVQKVLLGRFWGTEALGLYGRAYQLVNLPTKQLNAAIGGVAYAALSRLQGEPDRFKSYFLKGYSLVLAMTLPITIGCALLAEDLVLVVLGPQWQDAIILLRLLAPTILAFALIDPFAWMLISIGKVKRSLYISLVIAPLVIGAYSLGLPYGPKGVAVGFSSMMLALILPVIAWCKHGTNIGSLDIWKAVRPPLLSGLAATAFTLAVSFLLVRGLPPLPRLLGGGAALSGCYLGMLLLVMKQKDFYLDLIREILKRRRA